MDILEHECLEKPVWAGLGGLLFKLLETYVGYLGRLDHDC